MKPFDPRLKALSQAVASLALAVKLGGTPQLEDALADVIAEGRLAAEKLKLNRKRMTERVNARLEKELA